MTAAATDGGLVAALGNHLQAFVDLLAAPAFVTAASLLAVGTLVAVVFTCLYLWKRSGHSDFVLWAVASLEYAAAVGLYRVCLQLPRAELVIAIGLALAIVVWATLSANPGWARVQFKQWYLAGSLAAALGLIGWLVYSHCAARWLLAPAFALLAALQFFSAWQYARGRDPRPGIGPTRLAAVLWGCQCLAFPVLAFEAGLTLTLLGSCLVALLLLSGLLADVLIARAALEYREVLDGMADAVLLIDCITLRVLETNPAACELTQRQAAELLSCTFSTLCPDLPAAQRPGDPVKLFGAVFKPFNAFPIARADGTTVSCEGEARLLTWGTTTAMQVRLRPATDLKTFGTARRGTDKLAALGQLVAGVAHELNNPLAVILGRTQILAKRAAAAERKELEKIRHETERAAKIVRDLLTFVRPCQPQLGAVNLNHLIDEVLDARDTDLRAQRIEIEKRLRLGLPLTKADGAQLEQVLVNLLNNAIFALSTQRGPRKITITTLEHAKFLRIRVADNGPGIPRELQRKIFEPFFTTKPPGQGTGLGLAISATIIQEHGGKLWVESSPDNGSVFNIELPHVPCAAEETAAAPRTRPAASAATPSWPGRRILIVDDEPGICEVLQSALTSEAFVADVAGNGIEALHKIATSRYDLVLSDLCMPEMDGETFYNIACQQHAVLARRIVFITGDTVAQKSREFLASLGTPWISKPFNIVHVIDVVNQMLDDTAAAAGPVSPPAASPARPRVTALPPMPAAKSASAIAVKEIERPAAPLVLPRVSRPAPVVLPPAPVATRPPAVVGQPAPASAAPSTTAASVPVPPPATAPRLLVVDDEPHIREVLQLTLEGCGYTVDTAVNGADAMQHVLSTGYNLVFSDITMPIMDGADFYDAVCRVSPDLSRRIIFVTGDAVSPKARDLLSRVQTEYLTKPFNLDRIESIVREHLSSQLTAAPA